MTWGRLLSFVAAMSIVVSTGIAYGLRTNRWGSDRARGAVLALESVPMALDSWKGRIESMDPRAVEGAQLDGYLMRRYTDARSGESVSLLIACGRPGPISVHTPDVCYLGAGYQMTRSGRITMAVPGTSKNHAQVSWADFDKVGALPLERVRILWSWSATGDWRAPDNPRIVFGLAPVLYKIYVVRRVHDERPPTADDTGLDFVRRLVPQLGISLFQETETTPAGSPT